MKPHTPTLILLLFLVLPLYPQTGTIHPGKTLTNKTADTLYYLPAITMRKLLASHDRVHQLEKINRVQSELNASLDSMVCHSKELIAIKEEVASYWKEQLLINDQELENCQIQSAMLQQKLRRINKNRRWYLLGGGILAGMLLLGR